jgi:hypothetical protein
LIDGSITAQLGDPASDNDDAGSDNIYSHEMKHFIFQTAKIISWVEGILVERGYTQTS